MSDEYEDGGEGLVLPPDVWQAAREAGEAIGRLLAAVILCALQEIDLEHIVREEIGDGIREAAREELEDVLKKNRLVIVSALGGALPEAVEELRRGQKRKAKK